MSELATARAGADTRRKNAISFAVAGRTAAAERPAPGDHDNGSRELNLRHVSGRPLRILVVEDDPLVAAVIQDIVRDAGGAVAGTITSALAAVGAAAVIAPDAVIMDVQLTGPMDGIEAAGVIRARRNMPIVIITGAVDETDLRARLAGLDGVEAVLKPLYSHTLCSAILRACQRSAF